jgi:hypothetical protein
MKLSRVMLAVCFVTACASGARAQGEGGQPPPASVGTSAPPRVLQTRASRAAVVRLKNGESLACHFLSANDDTIEVEAAGARREIALDAVAGIDFSPRTPAEGKTQAAARGAAVTPAARTPLVVTARLCETFDRFTALSGEVRNTSPRRIGNLTAVGTFRNKNGAVIKVEQQLLGDVPAGHTATFKVMWWYDPRIDSCAVSFKIFGGGRVAHTESLEQ